MALLARTVCSLSDVPSRSADDRAMSWPAPRRWAGPGQLRTGLGPALLCSTRLELPRELNKVFDTFCDIPKINLFKN